MKPRKVVIVIEAKSDWSLNELRKWYKSMQNSLRGIEVHQVSVQVVKEGR